MSEGPPDQDASRKDAVPSGAGRRRPPWWPDDEAWPPVGPPRRMRHGFLWQAGCLAGFLLLIASIGLSVLAWHVAEAVGARAPGGGGLFVGLVLVLVILLGASAAGRRVRRFAMPIGDLIEAAGRVEEADYSVRVAERPDAPPPVRALIRAFNGMSGRLEADEHRRRQLLADLGHELRTPLAVLQGELEAMVDGVRPADPANLGAALDETRVLARLVEDIRTLSLADAGTLALHREPTDVDVLVGEVARSLADRAAAGAVSIDVTTAPDLPLVDVDPVRIREVLTNLVANALRYAPRGSSVAIGAGRTADGRRLILSVSDAGPGIAEDLLPRIFDRFVAGEAGGSGLGLAIARQLVEAHSGRIGVDSRPGAGSRFWVELPLEAAGR